MRSPVRSPKALWNRPKDVADMLVLAALGERLDRDYVRRTLEGLLPPDDPRHAEVARMLAG